VTSLATAAMINAAVTSSINSRTTYIVVPNTSYQLLYGSVQPTNGSLISFAVQSGGITYQLTADCNAGLLNARAPKTSQEAELLNAACQVAFGKP
jgi:p-aminobenzoyl-glutamate transporter AbgT